MQFKLLAIAALVAGVSAAGNKTITGNRFVFPFHGLILCASEANTKDSTAVPSTTGGPGGYGGPGGNGTVPTGTPSGVPSSTGAPSSGAFANAVSGGMIGAVVAAGLTLVCSL